MMQNQQSKKSKKQSSGKDSDLSKDSDIEQLIRERNDLNKTLSKLLTKIKKNPRT